MIILLTGAADGHFVPTITIGPVVGRSLRRVTRLG